MYVLVPLLYREWASEKLSELREAQTAKTPSASKVYVPLLTLPQEHDILREINTTEHTHEGPGKREQTYV